MKINNENVKYVGVFDGTLDLFESQYIVPDGVTYNSYVILDEKTVIMDAVDARAVSEWLQNLENALDGKTPDYLVVSHMEPDHSAGIAAAAKKYPDMKIVVNKRSAVMLANFAHEDYSEREVVVEDGGTLDIGERTLRFVFAPMVHWPEVMVTYDEKDKILFSADAFGAFGTDSDEDDRTSEARRYYFNIVGKYGVQVTSLLTKLAGLDVKTVCPLHGPILTDKLPQYVEMYKTWASGEAQYPQKIAVVAASMHGNTLQAARSFAQKCGQNAELFDLTRCDMSEALSAVFACGKLVCACCTYNSELFSPMSDFLSRIVGKAYKNRKVGFIESGSWAPQTAKLMRAEFEKLKGITFAETAVRFLSSPDDETEKKLQILAEEMIDK